MSYQNIGKGINLRNRKYFEAFREVQKISNKKMNIILFGSIMMMI